MAAPRPVQPGVPDWHKVADDLASAMYTEDSKVCAVALEEYYEANTAVWYRRCLGLDA